MKTMLADSKGLLRATRKQKGLTLLELIVAIAMLLILASAAVPIFRFTVVRRKESELRQDLREMRNAIDRYKDLADKNLIRSEVGSDGYPKDLETLVTGVNFGAAGDRVRFLRRIPIDPMTGKAEWTLQSQQDNPDSSDWSGNSLFDVRSKSQANALDGTPYSAW